MSASRLQEFGTLCNESVLSSDHASSDTAMLEPPDATGIRRLHVVRETDVPGVRDAVGRHLALLEMPGRQTRNVENRIALRRMDLTAVLLTPSPLRQRADDGVGRSAPVGSVLIHAP